MAKVLIPTPLRQYADKHDTVELGGTTVTVNGRPIQLLYVSGSQIYAQLPFNVDGNVTVRITTANGSSEMSY